MAPPHAPLHSPDAVRPTPFLTRIPKQRNRDINCCQSCRRLKVKCNKSRPSCLGCLQRRQLCIYPSYAAQRQAKTHRRLIDLNLEGLSGDVQSLFDFDHYAEADISELESDSGDDENPLIASPVAVSYAGFADEAEDSAISELGVRLGKFRMTGKIGAFFRPHMVVEVGCPT